VAMASKKGRSSYSSYLGAIFTTDLYKRNQGRVTRQATAAAIVLVVAFGAWTLSQGPLMAQQEAIKVGVPTGIVVLAAWLSFRLVNFPRFADFLVSVQAEIDKVTWASRSELYRATVVVVSTMVFLGAMLFLYDQLWFFLFKAINFLDL